MSRLNKEQQDLILDFYFRCGDETSIQEGRDLIATNSEAAKLYDNLEFTLKDLDAVKYEPCPDNLVELTVARLNHAASQAPFESPTSPSRDTTSTFALADLIRAEQDKPNRSFPQPVSRTRFPFPKFRLIEIAAMAAVFLAISGIGLPVFSNMRQSSWKTTCLSRLGQIGQAIGWYGGDHEGMLPSVPMAAGTPWYMIGWPGTENVSNTRNMWVLVQSGYAEPSLFVCPGYPQSKSVCGTFEDFSRLNDFPCHKNISFSSQLICGKVNPDLSGNIPLLADRNPLFENLCTCNNPSDRSRFSQIEIHLDPRLQVRMSRNHRGQGQNILFRDGSVTFLTGRTIGNDDIFTLKDIDRYKGTEAPCSDGTDLFLVP